MTKKTKTTGSKSLKSGELSSVNTTASRKLRSLPLTHIQIRIDLLYNKNRLIYVAKFKEAS